MTSRLVGLAAVLLGLGLRRWALRHLRNAGVTSLGQLAVTMPPPGPYATGGPYRLLRHPMYAGSYLVFGGLGLALTGWWGSFVGIVLALFPHYNQRSILEEHQRRVTEAVRRLAGVEPG